MAFPRSLGARAALALSAAACAAASLMAAPGAGAAIRPAPADAAIPPDSSGPYATLLFSRTEMGAADNCAPDDAGIAPLGTVVAPYLHSLGMSATGSLVTGRTGATSRTCTHYGDSLTASWADATGLAHKFGWSFVSHTATYPADISSLTPAQLQAETCGSAAAIDAHGLPGGHGMIAYPGSHPVPQEVQADYSAHCFAWGRRYFRSAMTPESAGTTPPYFQHTQAVAGGPCNTPSAPCYRISSQGRTRYSPPQEFVSEIDALKPGQWFTLQAYILVTGTSPRYASNQTRWDCTSANPDLHWSNDTERYCYSDWQKIARALAARRDVIVTDPLTVGKAFGRPASFRDAPGRSENGRRAGG